MALLEFTPLEFETCRVNLRGDRIKLEFTPLEFETKPKSSQVWHQQQLEFTPLEFET